ncbi:hypothetical protein BC831DRAFT_174280 [Entophlyctis helioformis]|nr:hypothetical protein BC831DRAFT_174280 [Entophlyctis helioformis]
MDRMQTRLAGPAALKTRMGTRTTKMPARMEDDEGRSLALYIQGSEASFFLTWHFSVRLAACKADTPRHRRVDSQWDACQQTSDSQTKQTEAGRRSIACLLPTSVTRHAMATPQQSSGPQLQPLSQSSRHLTSAQVDAILKSLSNHSDQSDQRHASAQLLANPFAVSGDLNVSPDYALSKNSILLLLAIFRMTLLSEVLEAAMYLLAAVVHGDYQEAGDRATAIVVSGAFDRAIEILEANCAGRPSPQRSQLIRSCLVFLRSILRAHGNGGQQAAARFCGEEASSGQGQGTGGGETSKGLIVAMAMLEGYPKVTELETVVRLTECLRRVGDRPAMRVQLQSCRLPAQLVELLKQTCSDEWVDGLADSHSQPADQGPAADKGSMGPPSAQTAGTEPFLASLYVNLASSIKNLLAKTSASKLVNRHKLVDAEVLQAIHWLLANRQRPIERIQALELLVNATCVAADIDARDTASAGDRTPSQTGSRDSDKTDQLAEQLDWPIAVDLVSLLMPIATGTVNRSSAQQKDPQKQLQTDQQRALDSRIQRLALMGLHNVTLRFGEEARVRASQHLRYLLRLTGAEHGCDMNGAAISILRNLALVDKPPKVRMEIASRLGRYIEILSRLPETMRQGQGTAAGSETAANTVPSGFGKDASAKPQGFVLSDEDEDAWRDVQADTLSLICNLSTNDQMAQWLAVEGEAPLFSALFSLVMFSSQTRLQQLALSCVRNLCIDEASCSTILSMGGDRILELLYHGIPGVQRECLQVVRNLALQHGPSFHEICNSDGFLPEIVASLCTGDGSVQRCAIDFVQYCLDRSAAMPSLCIELLDAGCLPALLVPTEERGENAAAAAGCFERLQEMDKALRGSGDPWMRIYKEWKAMDRERAARKAALKQQKQQKQRKKQGGGDGGGQPAGKTTAGKTGGAGKARKVSIQLAGAGDHPGDDDSINTLQATSGKRASRTRAASIAPGISRKASRASISAGTTGGSSRPSSSKRPSTAARPLSSTKR